MSKLGEPLDVAKELADMKCRLEALELRVYTINKNRDPATKPFNMHDLLNHT